MGKYSMWQMVPSLVITFIGVEWARKSGIKKSFVISTWASAVLLVVLIILTPIFVGPGVTTLLTLLALQTAIGGLAGNIVIPMIADCIDYEVYRTDNYIPGMMGTIFSFVDKLISSGATFVVGLAIAWAGFGKTQIPVDTFVGNKFTFAIMFILFGLPLIGHIASLIAMKFYILDGAMMYEIKEKIAARKAGHHNARLITK
jgi:Na+/melibiose symporter-like transporter